MFMIYIRCNGNIAKQEIREARNLEAAKQSALFDFIAENDIGFTEMTNVETQGHEIMYHVYRLLTDEKGNVHKTPFAVCSNLKVAESYSKAWSNGSPMGIYKIEKDGTETRVR